MKKILKYFKEKVFVEDRLIVAEENGKIVGFCAFKEGWVNHLYVLPGYQERGIGRALLDKAKRAYPNLKLWVFQKNTNAREFYEKNGFVLKIMTDGSRNEEHEPDALYSWPKKQLNNYRKPISKKH